jgi:hypothetical protein
MDAVVWNGTTNINISLQVYKSIDQSDYICKEKSPKRWSVTQAQMDEDQAAFVHSPWKSTRHIVQPLNMKHTTVHNILQKF